jgi:hypothetical protein
MSALSKPFKVLPPVALGPGSREVLGREASNEFVFAVVGHAGSGTSVIAATLGTLLAETSIGTDKFDVVTLRARDVITSWAMARDKMLPPLREKRYLKDVELLQDYGDEMRSEKTADGSPEYAAVARGLVEMIQRARADRTGATYQEGTPVPANGKPRAYILDSIRHPAEVLLLRNIYRDAFVLIGVVCEEEKRISRMRDKYEDCGTASAQRS